MASTGSLHPQVDANYSEVKEEIKDGRYRPSPDGRELDNMENISEIWPEAPPNNQVHVFVTLPSPTGGVSGWSVRRECFIWLILSITCGDACNSNHRPPNTMDRQPFIQPRLSVSHTSSYPYLDTLHNRILFTHIGNSAVMFANRYSLSFVQKAQEFQIHPGIVMAIFSTLSDALQVRGTPASGKTTLTELLAQYIGQQDPVAPVILLYGWPLDQVREIGLFAYLETKGFRKTEKSYLIFDEAQMSYQDAELWDRFFKNLETYDQFAIAFAGYGSPTSRPIIEGTPIGTPIYVSDAQRVALRAIDFKDGLGAAGPLFSREEFNELVSKQFSCSEHYFDSSFFDVVFEITGGHVGAIYDFVRAVAVTNVCFFYDVGTHYLTSYLSLIVNSRVMANFTRGRCFRIKSLCVACTHYSKNQATFSEGVYHSISTFRSLTSPASSPKSFVNVQ
jgi:hypothetical protein